MSGPYIQHNPLFPNGLDAIVGYIKQAGRIPCEVKRVAIDGDLAFVHVRYLDWGGQETAGVDIFRFDADGKVVEHWDVLHGTSILQQRQQYVLGNPGPYEVEFFWSCATVLRASRESTKTHDKADNPGNSRSTD